MSGRTVELDERVFEHDLAAGADAVFPLLCPVREHEWLDGWNGELLRSSSGFVEQGAVFVAKNEDGSETVWFTTLHDPERRRVAFVRVIPAFALIEMTIDVAPRAEGGSRLRVAYRLTGLSAAGNEHIGQARATGFAPLRERTAWLARSLDHFIAAGTMLRRPL